LISICFHHLAAVRLGQLSQTCDNSAKIAERFSTQMILSAQFSGVPHVPQPSAEGSKEFLRWNLTLQPVQLAR